MTGLAAGSPLQNVIFTDGNNRFDRNEYYLGSRAKYFAFDNNSRNEVEWVEVYGQDTNSVFHREP